MVVYVGFCIWLINKNGDSIRRVKSQGYSDHFQGETDSEIGSVSVFLSIYGSDSKTLTVLSAKSGCMLPVKSLVVHHHFVTRMGFYMYIYIHTYIHTYIIYIYIHTYIHT